MRTFVVRFPILIRDKPLFLLILFMSIVPESNNGIKDCEGRYCRGRDENGRVPVVLEQLRARHEAYGPAADVDKVCQDKSNRLLFVWCTVAQVA